MFPSEQVYREYKNYNTATFLSESSEGLPINVAATSSPGTAVHSVPNLNGEIHEIWLFANNTSASDVDLTLEFGDTTNTHTIVHTIPAKESVQVSHGTMLGEAKIIRAYAGTGDVIRITGTVYRKYETV